MYNCTQSVFIVIYCNMKTRLSYTVGVQSISLAQSIAHSQINDSISHKNKTKSSKNFFYKRFKMVNLAADSWTKYRIFYFKCRKYLCPMFLFFAEIAPAIFFRRRRKKSSASPDFAPRDGPQAHKVYCTYKVLRVSISLQKTHI